MLTKRFVLNNLFFNTLLGKNPSKILVNNHDSIFNTAQCKSLSTTANLIANHFTITSNEFSTKIHSRLFSTKNENDSSVRMVTLDKHTKNNSKADLTVVFEMHDGRELIGKACHGDSLLDVVLNNDLEIDGFGACEGTLACSTCHLILSQEDFDRVPNAISDEEMDMLDLAFGLTETSRLGCQIYMSKDFDGLRVKVPPGVNDVRQR